MPNLDRAPVTRLWTAPGARFALIAGGVAAAAFLWAEAVGRPELQLWTKTLPVLAMLWLLGGAGGSYVRRLRFGLAWSALGDLLLEVDGGFLAGMGAFLVAHLCYIRAFVGEEARWRWPRAVPFALWGAAVLAWLWPGLVAAGMALPVSAYTAVICAMMWRAVARFDAAPGPSRDAKGSLDSGAGAESSAVLGDWLGSGKAPTVRWAAAGALLFAVSDTLIAVSRFGGPLEGAVERAMPYAIILLYWAGQLGLTISGLRRPVASRPGSRARVGRSAPPR